MKYEVIVVGAGIAGLAAAWTLSRAGRSVVVLEAGPGVGGRMCSEKAGEFTLDRGAQFLSSGYASMMAFAAQAGIGPEAFPATSAYSAILRGGTPRRIRASSPIDILRTGLLGVAGGLAWLKAAWPNRKLIYGASLEDYAAWETVDDLSTAGWMADGHRQDVLARLLEPMLQGLYFQAPEETSRALSMLVAAYGARGHRTLALKNGMGFLPERLAAGLNVESDCQVHRIERRSGQVRVHSSHGCWTADQVVCAVPAPIAQMLLDNQHDIEADVLATLYACGVNISWMLDGAYEPPKALRDVYGLLIPRAERHGIAAFAFETTKCEDRGPRHQLVNTMLDDRHAQRVLAFEDSEVVTFASEALDRILPGMRNHVHDFRVHRWPMAMPKSPVGRARLVSRYRRQVESARPLVVLAGDYLGAPTTDSALATGVWAARALQGTGQGYAI